ncbi:MAG: MFS transporter [Chitinophagaceae bacterium]|nr:MFS transporter [Chitinophagaceae bacterium]
MARFCFIMALQMVNIGIGWYLYELTGNPLALGWVGLSEVIPAISLALYAGHRVDISDKRTLLRNGMVFYWIAVAGLGLVTFSGDQFWLSSKTVELLIYFFIFCTGVFRAFTGPTFQAIVAQLVSRDKLPQAITLSTTAWQTASVAGPVLSGFIISKLGISWMFGLALTLVLFAIFRVNGISRLPVAHVNPGQRTWESVKNGLSFVWKTREVFGAMCVDMFAVLFGGATAMLPVFAKDILHVDATGMGMLKAAQGSGTILMLFYLTKYPLQHTQGKKMLYCVAMFGVCILVFALSKNFWLSFAALLFSGVFDAVSMLVRSTIMQLYVPDDMRGRVGSVNSMFINSSNELGQFESGIAARLLGTVPSVIFGGTMTLIVVLIAWLKAPSLRKLQY